jgi:hypothetical protein
MEKSYQQLGGYILFISYSMSYIILRGRWCDMIVLNVLALTGDKINDV